MKSRIVSCAFIIDEYEGKPTKHAHVVFKREDGGLSPLVINTLNPKREFMEKSLRTSGLEGDINDESLKRLNGPVEEVLDTKSIFFINIIDGRVTRAQKL
jgi:hypothetical protein